MKLLPHLVECRRIKPVPVFSLGPEPLTKVVNTALERTGLDSRPKLSLFFGKGELQSRFHSSLFLRVTRRINSHPRKNSMATSSQVKRVSPCNHLGIPSQTQRAGAT